MLQALGYRFLNADGLSVVARGQVLSEINSIDSALAHPAIKEARFTVACDVDNPFYGTNGMLLMCMDLKKGQPTE